MTDDHKKRPMKPAFDKAKSYIQLYSPPMQEIMRKGAALLKEMRKPKTP